METKVDDLLINFSHINKFNGEVLGPLPIIISNQIELVLPTDDCFLAIYEVFKIKEGNIQVIYFKEFITEIDKLLESFANTIENKIRNAIEGVPLIANDYRTIKIVNSLSMIKIILNACLSDDYNTKRYTGVNKTFNEYDIITNENWQEIICNSKKVFDKKWFYIEYDKDNNVKEKKVMPLKEIEKPKFSFINYIKNLFRFKGI